MASSYDPADDFDGIVAAFFAHLARRQEPSFDFVKIPENGFLFPPDAPTLWVKFDVDVSSMVSESEMQTYVYHHLPPQENCCIPKVHRVYQLPDKTNGDFSGARLEDAPWGLIVMDYVKGTRLHDITMAKQDPCFQEILASRIAKILVALSTVKAPQGSKPGPMGGQTMSCLVWGRYEFEAPGSFDTLGDLQGYINEQIKESRDPARVDFSNEPLVLCYGDFNEGNFILEDAKDPHSTLTIIDFGSTNWLPRSFFLWEVISRSYQGGPFYRCVGDAVKALLTEPPNMENIQALSSLLRKREGEGF